MIVVLRVAYRFPRETNTVTLIVYQTQVLLVELVVNDNVEPLLIHTKIDGSDHGLDHGQGWNRTACCWEPMGVKIPNLKLWATTSCIALTTLEPYSIPNLSKLQ